MAKTTNNSAENSAIRVEGSPQSSRNSIYRHGQDTRLIQSRVCPCVNNGAPDLWCPLCNGLGYIYTFQRKVRIFDEVHTRLNAKNRIETDFFPILEVEKVMRWLYNDLGGNLLYKVREIKDRYIFIEAENETDYLLPHDSVLVTYSYDRWTFVENENPVKFDNWILNVTGLMTPYSKSANPNAVSGDISRVDRVYNKTKDVYYEVDRYFKSLIVLKPNIEKPVDFDDVLEVDYYYCPSTKVLTQTLSANDSKQKWGNIETGDIEAIVNYEYMLKKGDIITFLFAEMVGECVVERSQSDVDLLPFFDITMIMETIFDAAGKQYFPGQDVIIYDYNKVKWVGNKPTAGTKYNILLSYRPSYVVFNDLPQLKSSENKQFPKTVHLRKYDRMNNKDIVILNQKA